MAETEHPVDFSQATWRKSSHSSGNGECVEVAFHRTEVALRDSKSPGDPFLRMDEVQWARFLAEVKAGFLDKL
ncbi:DUF397 domain-containing protein [Actinocorallia sp. B10E7]|uniref:DUF397 domain-containing protein n=1 Tax=Actinocorallia sp. B10E7 TaxID=3153558 RepID=UPI00325E7625